jgi:hypothetical protein
MIVTDAPVLQMMANHLNALTYEEVPKETIENCNCIPVPASCSISCHASADAPAPGKKSNCLYHHPWERKMGSQLTIQESTVSTEASYRFNSTLGKYIKHNPERPFFGKIISWKSILASNKNQWMSMPYNKVISQFSSLYGEAMKTGVHCLFTTLPGAITMMDPDVLLNLCMCTKPRPPPNSNILVPSLNKFSLQVQLTISNFEKGSSKFVDDHTLKHCKPLAMIDERTSDSRISKPPWQADSDHKVCLQHMMSTLPQSAPNIWIGEKRKSDG